jgi:hypothetical protein
MARPTSRTQPIHVLPHDGQRSRRPERDRGHHPHGHELGGDASIWWIFRLLMPQSLHVRVMIPAQAVTDRRVRAVIHPWGDS